MLQNQKHVFWEALVMAFFIFGIGILMGVLIENNRNNTLSEMYMKSELNLLDIKIQTEIISLNKINCTAVIQGDINFANKIYHDSKILDRYESASRLEDSLVMLQHKRYDLLRTLLWLNTIKIKQKCGGSIHTLVYLYDYPAIGFKEKTKQKVFSRFTQEIKEERGNNLVLIPIAKNMNITSLQMLMQRYRINQTTIILDENLTITELDNLYKIKNVLNKE